MSRPELQDSLKFAEHYTHPDFPLYKATSLSADADYSEAIAFFVNGVEDDPQCQNNLAIFFALGIHYQQDLEKARTLLISAIELKLPQAYFNLGLLEHYRLIPRTASTLHRFTSALSLGIKEASYYLGQHEERNISHADFDGNAMDRSEAFGDARVRSLRYYAVAADVGHVLALTRMGDIYHSEMEVRDDALAMKYYSQAAQKDHLPAMFSAATLLTRGYSPRLSVTETDKSAFYIHEECDPERITALQAIIIEKTRDPEAAITLLNRAWNIHRSVEALEMMGDIRKEEKDYRAAGAFYMTGMHKGSITCLAKCGEMFLICDEIRSKTIARDLFKQFKTRLAESRILNPKMLELTEMINSYKEALKPIPRKKKKVDGDSDKTAE
ncbi:tetratricopeptide repeat protein [Pantoea coffeiphila]|uniref:Tetratricopeptide repeat protein n=1 Tax=Pantoea coffeiphila TaxID=1465635 RepID=A0A2S9I9R4_9GAMM|nr:sel1 repeat family protein [Pantoea coffeiphila]PRD14464.1 hypothetical protein CQW29_16570 [Pantoea coffeiphila]